MRPPLVSIVTPSLNQGRFIRATIESVRQQTYQNVEHIVVDACSNDGTVDILRASAGRYNLRSIVEPDKGQPAGVNKGLHLANGQIYGWLNSDDLYFPDAVERAVNAFHAGGCPDLVYGNVDYIDEQGGLIKHGRTIPYDYRTHLYAAAIIPQPACFFTADAFWSVGGLDESLQWAMDGDCWLRMAERQCRFLFLRHTLAAFRLHSDSKTVAGSRAQLGEAEAVRANHYGHCAPWRRQVRYYYYHLKRQRSLIASAMHSKE